MCVFYERRRCSRELFDREIQVRIEGLSEDGEDTSEEVKPRQNLRALRFRYVAATIACNTIQHFLVVASSARALSFFFSLSLSLTK